MRRSSFLRYVDPARLSRLQTAADKAPRDASLQAQLLARLNEDQQHRRVRTRVESMQYALNEQGASEYLKAMAALDRLDHVRVSELTELLQRQKQQHFESLRRAEESGEVDQHRERDRHSTRDVADRSINYTGNAIPVTIEQIAASGKPFRVAVETSAKGFVLQMLLLGGSLFAVLFLMKNSNSGLDTFLKGSHSKAEDVDTSFSDVIGLEEAKQEVRYLVDFLEEPDKYFDFGVRMPKGLMMFGPPGVGKTHLARAMAGEAGVPFFYISGSSVEEMFVGLGARRIRELFKEAQESAPSIIFIDEIDALGSKREFGSAGTMRQTLNQMLTMMDGFKDGEGVLVIAATNSDEKDLDGALLRSGRFDKKVYLHAPFRDDRKKLFQYYLAKVPSGSGRDRDAMAEQMAGLTWGCTGADVSNIVNQAAIFALQRNSERVTMEDLQKAHADVILGPENLSLKSSENEKRLTAYHEAGHVLVALETPQATPPRQVTIVPRKNALGYMSKDAQDRVSYSREAYLAEMATAMGGRAAEQLIVGAEKVTSGAQSDFQAATQLAEMFVSEFGFSDLGFMSFSARSHGGRNSGAISDATKQEADKAISSLLRERYEYALQTLQKNSTAHHRLAKALLEFETLSYEEILKAVKGERIVRD